MGPTQLIVLNTAEAADELLVNRGTTYSGRPSPHVAFDIVSDGQRMVFMGYNHAWRVRRLHMRAGRRGELMLKLG